MMPYSAVELDIVHIVCRHEKVVEGITVCSEFRGHDRFLPVIQGVSMNDSPLKVRYACSLRMQVFIFLLCASVVDVSNRSEFCKSSDRLCVFSHRGAVIFNFFFKFLFYLLVR